MLLLLLPTRIQSLALTTVCDALKHVMLRAALTATASMVTTMVPIPCYHMWC